MLRGAASASACCLGLVHLLTVGGDEGVLTVLVDDVAVVVEVVVRRRVIF